MEKYDNQQFNRPYAAYVKENCLFHNIPDDGIQQIMHCSGALLRSYGKDEVIFRYGTSAIAFYALLRGHVSIVSYMPSGKLNFLYDVYAGNLMGEHYSNQISPHMHQYWYEAIACEESEVLEVPWKYLYNFCSNACRYHQQLIQNLYESIASKEWLAVRKINILGFTSVQERVAVWLLQEADENGVVWLQTTREEQAGYLCVARPSLSRTLMQMQKAHMLKVHRNRIQIVDRKKLENVL